MSHATMREHIKAEVDHLDPAVLQSIWEIIDRAKRQPAAVPKPAMGFTPSRADEAAGSSRPLQFVGENWTLEEFKRLSPEERAARKCQLKEKNHAWLQEKFSTLNAAWVVVVNSEVIAFGESLKNKPMPPQLLEICQRTEKFPFVFVNDKLIAIEESVSAWHNTIQPGDYYPTLPITLNSASGTIEVIGDFDTGCSHTFVDYDFLAAQKIIQREIIEDFERHQHLNRDFVYVDKSVRVELSANSGSVNTLDTRISCVRNWHASPFVEINPNRIALIGRDVLLELKPKVLLDFDKRQTEIGASAKLKPSRKKSATQKKRPPRRR